MNSNYGCGCCNIYMASDAIRIAEPDSGDLEEAEIVLMTPEELLQALGRGEVSVIGHAAGSKTRIPGDRRQTQQLNRSEAQGKVRRVGETTAARCPDSDGIGLLEERGRQLHGAIKAERRGMAAGSEHQVAVAGECLCRLLGV